MSSSSMTAARSQYLLDLLAQVPDPRKRHREGHHRRGADYVMTVKGNMPSLYRQLKALPELPSPP